MYTVQWICQIKWNAYMYHGYLSTIKGQKGSNEDFKLQREYNK